MPVGRAAINGSPYLGVYLRVGDSSALLPPATPPALEREVARVLGVPTVRTTVAASDLLGSMVLLTRRAVVVGERLSVGERRSLEAVAPLLEVEVRENALGNNVLANDNGALIHPGVPERTRTRLESALGTPVRPATIAGLATVGMAGAATNRGVLVHPRATEEEIEVVQSTLRVPVHRSTANFGVPVVGACLVANSRGAIVGIPTTPVEIVHLQEGLGILD